MNRKEKFPTKPVVLLGCRFPPESPSVWNKTEGDFAFRRGCQTNIGLGLTGPSATCILKAGETPDEIGTGERNRDMPCHDILIETAIKQVSASQISDTVPMWNMMASVLNLIVPNDFYARADYRDNLVLSGSFVSADIQAEVVQRYQQSYVARQIFASLEADGYEMHAYVSPDHEGTWVINARDVTRNATIGVVVYKTLEFEIDFLDVLHDDSVWLVGGEFGRVIERIQSMGLATEVVKLDIDDNAKKMYAQSSNALYS